MKTRRPQPGGARGAPEQPFAGFEHFTANFLYCPNQFFDVCLPNSSRGAVRLVAYLLRRTLGWLDEEGSPIEENVSVSYRDLIESAGISRGAIGPAIDEAIRGGFIARTQEARPTGPAQAAQSARFTLRWDSGAQYIKTAQEFRGFYAAEGHRTPIPNAFFDRVVPGESLAVVKVVGTVLRHTVGYHNQFGRRLQAPLSYDYIQRYANVQGRATLSGALQVALARNYIRRVHPGCVAASAQERRPATYAVKWLDQADTKRRGSKNEPAGTERFNSRTSTGSKYEPVERFKKRTKETTNSNDTSKQQQPAPAVAANNSENTDAVRLLQSVGFDLQIADQLSRGRGLTEIGRQIEWLPHRSPSRNPLGLLRRAIEEDWSQPVAAGEAERRQAARQRAERHTQEQAKSDAKVTAEKLRRHERRQELLRLWQGLSQTERRRYHRAAIAAAASDMLRRRLSRHDNLDEPPLATLEAMAQNAAPRGESS